MNMSWECPIYDSIRVTFIPMTLRNNWCHVVKHFIFGDTRIIAT